MFVQKTTSTIPPPDTWESHTARSVTRWGRSGAVIAVAGELDAANSAELTDHVQRCAAYCEWLVLDLHELEFIGTAGFVALQSINARCMNAKVCWSLVASVAVSRLLRVCDPDGALPTAQSVADMLVSVQNGR